MTQEQEFFLSVLADYMNKRKTNPPDGLDWQQLVSYAAQHQLLGILWYQCKPFLSSNKIYDDASKRLESMALVDISSYMKNLHAYKELMHILQNNHIPHFSVKGLEVAALFPIPEFRTMSDIDIIIPGEEKDHVKEIMEHLGYQLVKQDYELVFARQTVIIEIHDNLVYRENQEKPAIKKYFERCWDYVFVNEQGESKLDWNYHFAFLIEHTKKHFSGNGIGFRQFMDLAVVASTITSLDWEMIEENLRRIGLWTFTLRALEFCQKWFKTQLPINTEEIDQGFYEDSTELVFSNGVFGFNNKHHKEHSLDRRLRLSILPRALSKIMLVVKEVFIPYKYMIDLQYCSFLKGRRFLLPYAWLYRVVYVVLKKRRLLETKRKLLFDSEDVLLYHRQLMRKWGI